MLPPPGAWPLGPGREGSCLAPTATSPHPAACWRPGTEGPGGAGGRHGRAGAVGLPEAAGCWWGGRAGKAAGGGSPAVPGRALGCRQRRASSVPGVAATAQRERPEGRGVFLALQQQVSAHLCHVTPAKSPAGSNKGGFFLFVFFCVAVKTSAVLLNAVSLCRARAAEMPRLRQSAPREKGGGWRHFLTQTASREWKQGARAAGLQYPSSFACPSWAFTSPTSVLLRPHVWVSRCGSSTAPAAPHAHRVSTLHACHSPPVTSWEAPPPSRIILHLHAMSSLGSARAFAGACLLQRDAGRAIFAHRHLSTPTDNHVASHQPRKEAERPSITLQC